MEEDKGREEGKDKDKDEEEEKSQENEMKTEFFWEEPFQVPKKRSARISSLLSPPNAKRRKQNVLFLFFLTQVTLQ